MSDRELLEMAAKAAGLKLIWGGKYLVGDDEVDCTDLPYIVGDIRDESPAYWHPLADDGDALRLAVALGLVLNLSPRKDCRGCTVVSYDGLSKVSEPCHDGREAAARRAIVRAAAEIGRGMQ